MAWASRSGGTETASPATLPNRPTADPGPCPRVRAPDDRHGRLLHEREVPGRAASRVRATDDRRPSVAARTRVRVRVVPGCGAWTRHGSPWSRAGAGGSARPPRDALASAGWDVAITYRERADAADDVVADVPSGRAPGDRDAGRSRRRRRRRAALPPRSTTSSVGSTCSSTTPASSRRPGPSTPTPPTRLDAVLRLNVVGAFLVAGAAVRRMSTARRRAGRRHRQRVVPGRPARQRRGSTSTTRRARRRSTP